VDHKIKKLFRLCLKEKPFLLHAVPPVNRLSVSGQNRRCFFFSQKARDDAYRKHRPRPSTY